MTGGRRRARHSAWFAREVSDLFAWVVTGGRPPITRLTRIDWRTVGAIIEHIVADELDVHRIVSRRLSEIGIEEASYRNQHHYLTLEADHRTATPVGRRGQGHHDRR